MPMLSRARRGTQDIDVTGAITTGTTTLDVPYTSYACDGSILQSFTQATEYDVHRIALVGVEVDDALSMPGLPADLVPCPPFAAVISQRARGPWNLPSSLGYGEPMRASAVGR